MKSGLAALLISREAVALALEVIMHEIVVIEDSLIVSMVQNPAFAGIPCLVNQADDVMPSPSSCGTCARKKLEKQRAAFARIKTCLSGLSVEKKDELKKLLNAKHLRVVFRTATGQTSIVTF